MDLTIAQRLGVRFHHLGLLTDAPEQAAGALGVLGYSVAPAVFDPLQGVHLRMASLPVPGATIEIVTPASREGALAKLVTRRGDYMYHSCFVAREVLAVLAEMAKLGLRVVTVSPPKPAVLFGGKLVSFHAVQGLGLMEFIEDDG